MIDARPLTKSYYKEQQIYFQDVGFISNFCNILTLGYEPESRDFGLIFLEHLFNC